MKRSIQQQGGIQCWAEPPWLNQDVPSGVWCLPLKTPAKLLLRNYVVNLLILFVSPVGTAEAPRWSLISLSCRALHCGLALLIQLTWLQEGLPLRLW